MADKILKTTHGKNGVPALDTFKPFYRPDLSPFERVKEFDRLKREVRKYMIASLETHRDECGDVNLTALAESAAEEFKINDPGGPLDDPDSWIWDMAFEVSEN